MILTAVVVHSQTVRAPDAFERGYDASKKVNGQKRPIAADAVGGLWAMNLPADVADSTEAQMVLDALTRPFGDSAYDLRTLMDKAASIGFTIGVVRKVKGQQVWRDNLHNLDLNGFHRFDNTFAIGRTADIKHFTKVTFLVGNYYSRRRTTGMFFSNLLIL